MRVSEFIIESFDQPYPYSWTQQTVGAWRGRFKTTDGYGDINVEASDVTSKSYTVEFSVMDAFDVTGTGDQFKIFATIISMLKDFINAVQPNKLHFSANKGDPDDEAARPGSRAKLYTRMCQKLATSAGYELKVSNFNGDEITMFDLHRKL